MKNQCRELGLRRPVHVSRSVSLPEKAGQPSSQPESLALNSDVKPVRAERPVESTAAQGLESYLGIEPESFESPE